METSGAIIAMASFLSVLSTIQNFAVTSQWAKVIILRVYLPFFYYALKEIVLIYTVVK